MSERHRPSFQIHRLDDPADSPDQHYRAFWRIGGTVLRVQVWNVGEWLRIPESERPDDVQLLDGGVMVVRPVAVVYSHIDPSGAGPGAHVGAKTRSRASHRANDSSILEE